MPIRVVQALFFFPRGGSAQVIRYLSTALARHDVDVRLVSGSLGEPGEQSHAGTFFQGLDVASVDFSSAFSAGNEGRDPLREPVPMHPSYEDRANVPDRIFTAVAPEIGRSIESFWEEWLRGQLQEEPDLFHLHHLTPLQPAVRANWPGVPLIGHIHGTELKMLDNFRRLDYVLGVLGLDFDSEPAEIQQQVQTHWGSLKPDQQRIAGYTRWEYWRHARYWHQRLLDYAGMCQRLIVLTEDARRQAAELLDYDPAKIYPVPNGVDIDRFAPARLSPEERASRWQRWLVDEPQGWDETGVPGSVSYSREEVDSWFIDAAGERTPVLFYVGRFTGMKRVPLLIRAYKRAQDRFHYRAPLVIWGGSPGEWEREHPVTVARDDEAEGVFFVGWRGHEELPEGLNAADVMVAPSSNEPFGQVYLEAMSCELPVIATRSGGPPTFINDNHHEPDGWLIDPDDEQALADTLVQVVNDPDERRRRGANALQSVRSNYSWNQVAGTVRQIYEDLVDDC
jgi:D-inositol-3-phosphate glycosyltransferase